MSNILYIAQFFSTDSEPGGQGQRHYKHAKSLAEDGHQVTILTSGMTTMSGEGDVTEPHAEPEVELNSNLRIIRLSSPPMAKRCVVSRALKYIYFSFKALCTGLRLILLERSTFHFVLGSSPPLLIGLVAYLLSIVAGAQFLLEVRDLWSQTMAANGFIRNRFLILLNRWLESHLYQKSKRIITVSEAYTQDIEAQVPGSRRKIAFIPNGADLEYFRYPKLWKGSYLKEGCQKKFNVVYAGVFSDYTRLETLIEAASLLGETHPEIQLHLVGGGYQFNALQQQAAQLRLENVSFWGALPKNRVAKFIMEGDLSIINYRNLSIYGQVTPNKLFDYLAAGRPILACVPAGEISRILEESQAGKTIPPESASELAQSIVWFYEHPKEGAAMGKLGQRYVRRYYNRAKLVEGLLALFPRVIPIEPVKKREYAKNNVVPFQSRTVQIP